MAYVLHHAPADYRNAEGGGRASRIEVATAEWNGQRFQARSGTSGVMALARMLVAAGAPDGPWRALTVEGKPSTHGPSLHRLAELTISEPDVGSVKIIPFTPYQGRPESSGLQASARVVNGASSASGISLPLRIRRPSTTRHSRSGAGASTALESSMAGPPPAPSSRPRSHPLPCASIASGGFLSPSGGLISCPPVGPPPAAPGNDAPVAPGGGTLS